MLKFVLLVTSQDGQVVNIGKGVCIVSQILLVNGKDADVFHIYLTIHCTRRGECTIQIIVTTVDIGSTQLCSQVQTGNRRHDGSPLASEDVAITRRTVEVVVAGSIVDEARTGLVCIVVCHVHRTTILCHDATILITNVKWIDRTHRVGIVEEVR